MIKTYLGIDMGQEQLKLALVRGTKVIRSAVADMPDNLLRGGRVVSIEAMADLLRDTMRRNGMRCQNAALVLNGNTVYVKNVAMPLMNEEQLKINLPFEFKDYIADELKNYTYDYAMISTPADIKKLTARGKKDSEEEAVEQRMELTGVAVQTELLEELRLMLRRAGLKLMKAAPVCSAYSALIRKTAQGMNGSVKEYGIIDLGATSIRMQIFENDNYSVVRELNIGMHDVEEALAENHHVDIHLAHTYLMNNHENCQYSEVCRQWFDNISIGLVRAMNFYRFSNPDSQLSDFWITGGGANIPALCEAIEHALNVHIHSAEELLPVKKLPEQACMLLPAIGITM